MYLLMIITMMMTINKINNRNKNKMKILNGNKTQTNINRE